jgi:pilus assembly protein Flp/PilA
MIPIRALKNFILDESGPTTTEYAVMLALIIVICMAAISGIGTTLDSIFTNLDSSLPTGSAS